ncbi:DNA adenine methylase [Pontimicrobium aquaticum]|uniref:DNA methyltransferase n=1 Tax=Pontimicrobium aquaticum TaxID=2565367 RepID=A0A4U0EWT2_9FLAO|nr:DNA adenine methylase [Pontimicrobium aquaticum]TJY34832.1 DNA methyltransferase [Pontimicrobium aquaticum]
MLNSIKIEKFPTTRYQGSKRKILPWLYDNLKDLDFETVLDACGGTASVSYMFKIMNKHVTYNDILKFNWIIGKALIENQGIKITNNDLDFILKFDSSRKKGFIEKTFKDYYYTDKENKWLDNTINNINLIQGKNEYETDIKKAMCFYALYQASLRKRPFNLFHRKNLYIRTNDVKRNFGNKTTWEKDFTNEFKFFINELNEAIFDSEVECTSLNQSIFDIENSYDLVYFDVPYITKNGSNETSNYLKCYHFLEGITDYENWNDKIDYSTKNLRFKKPATDNEFSKSNIFQSMDTLFEKFQDSILVFSYKIGGVPSIDEIESLMKKYKKNVEIKSKHYVYALNKQNGNAAYNREVIIIGK